MNCNCALILAAGKGERLKPITNKIPKPLIQIHEFRLIEYHLFNLARAGITDIFINRAHLRHKFDELLDLKNYPDVCISYLDEPEGALETAGALINAFRNTDSERLIVVNGDIWSKFNYSNINKLPQGINDNAHIILTTNPAHNLQGDFSLAGNRLIERDPEKQSYTYTGIGIYRRRLFENQTVKYLKLAPVLKQQIELNKVSASVTRAQWMDIGTLQRLNDLRKQLKSRSEND